MPSVHYHDVVTGSFMNLVTFGATSRVELPHGVVHQQSTRMEALAETQIESQRRDEPEPARSHQIHLAGLPMLG